MAMLVALSLSRLGVWDWTFCSVRGWARLRLRRRMLLRGWCLRMGRKWNARRFALLLGSRRGMSWQDGPGLIVRIEGVGSSLVRIYARVRRTYMPSESARVGRI